MRTITTFLRKEPHMPSIPNRLIDGIPVTEYVSAEAGVARGVFFLVHGHTGNRTHLSDLATRIAEAGWFAVAVDAFKHGERRASPYFGTDGKVYAMAMPEVILHTCADLKRLSETFYAAHAPHLFYGGRAWADISPSRCRSVKAAEYASIGTPDLYRHYAVTKYPIVGSKGIETLLALDAPEIGLDYAPYMDVKIVIASGAEDPVVDYHFVVDFHDALVRAGHEKISIALYPVGHVVPAEMQEAAISALLE
ncbi:MAG: hypothetical protein MZU97_11540 [Bacillus subtilis]|nr:hypothetical protein [Bacillus subtilis]